MCIRDSWGIAFLAILSYGAVAVPILHEFKADNIRHIVNHSEARILFAGTPIWEELQKEEMPKPETVIKMEDYSLFYNTNPALAKAHEMCIRDRHGLPVRLVRPVPFPGDGGFVL